MNTPVKFPDVEAALVGWLPAAVSPYGVDAPVSTQIPNPRPPKFVRLFRTGGPSRDVVVDDAQVTFECWANSDTDAADMALVVRAVILAVANTDAGGDLLYRAREFSGPARLPDESGQHRYSWTVQVSTRGVPLTV